MKLQRRLFLILSTLYIGACGAAGPSNNNAGSVCGNAVIEPGEACDDGNRINDPTCSADCQRYCGDGNLDEDLGEACDGADFGSETCETMGYGPGAISCQACAIDTSACSGVCGDGICQEGEHPACVEDCAVVSISCAQQNTCAVLADGSARCWGGGWLGAGEDLVGMQLVPVRVLLEDLATEPTALESGQFHSCAITKTGTMGCWGENNRGQLGDDSLALRNTPTEVLGIETGEVVSAASDTTCAIVSGGEVRCWGSNSYGSLGLSDIVDMSSVPVTITLPLPAETIAVSGHHVCAVLEDGTARCWGDNESGQLGDGQGGVGQRSEVPVEVAGVADAAQIAAGQNHTCVLTVNGAIRCWGANESGQLGNGTFDNSPSPVDVIGLTDAMTISASTSITCSVTQSGTIYCWGMGASGRLGNGAEDDTNVPVEVSNIGANGLGVDCGPWHTCAFLTDGTARCWGNGNQGQLGNGNTFDTNVPVEVLIH